MRLIDADALIEDLEYDVELDARTLDDMDFVGRDRETVQFDKDCKQNAIDLLQNAPTIEERKRGKWYKPTGMMPPEYAGVYRCSECDEIAMRDWKRHRQILTKFCPNCGCEMRQEGEEHETD